MIVSFTSFPARINGVADVVDSLNKQFLRPSEVVLVLADTEFTDRRVPSALQKQVAKGRVRIIWVEQNMRSYKKLLPLLECEQGKPIITVDDDVVYPFFFLLRLFIAHRKYSSDIIGNRGVEVQTQGRTDDLTRYDEWPRAKRNASTRRTLLTGRGGILYPPSSLASEVLNYELAKSCCPNADDMWFKVMALRAGTNVRQVGSWRNFTSLAGNRDTPALSELNTLNGENERQLKKALTTFGLRL